jgi:hypothetical protein
MIPTGNTFTGTIDDNTGSFSIKGTLTNKIVELSAVGYYFNEVSGSLSSATLTLSALSDLTDISSVNVNLMTHLEKKRVEYLMDNSKMTFAAAKTQAQTEIMKIFNIDNVTLGNSETLDISKSGDGNAVLLAISAILQSDKTEAELTELLSAINTDIRYDGTIDVGATKQKLLDGVDYVKPRIATIRSNIETRYSNVGMVASIPAFESYVLKLDITAPTVASTSHADNTTKIAVNLPITATFSDYLDNSTVTSTNFFLNDNSSNLITSTITYSDKTATLTPNSNLSENGTHIATIKTGITDLAGHALESDYSWSFKTGDFTAPIVAEETAVTSLTNDSTPSYTFSSTETGTITYGGSCSSSITAATSGNNSIDLSTLSDGTYDNCTVTVTDSAGNAGNTIKLTSFTIETVAPTVSSTSPSDNETFVSVNAGVTITFSEVIDNSTVTINTTDTTCSGAIQLSADNFTNCIKLSSNMTISGDNVTIYSNDNLSQATTYKIKATTQVTDLALNSLTNNYIHSTGFTTFNKPSQIIFTQDGATYPNNGGSPSTGKYFAQPFRPSDNISFNYAGAAIWDCDVMIGTCTAVSKVHIYTSTGSKCHQSEGMGTPDCNPNSAVVSVTPSGNNYFGDLVTINSYFTQAYFGSSSISLSDNTTYFFVVEFSSNVSMSIGICSGSLSYAGRRFSTNGSSWSNWEGNSNCTYQYRPVLFYLGQ